VIREATPIDAEAIASIYNHYVTETIVTFEEEPVATTEMARRIEEVRAASYPWLVAEHVGRIVGYAYATPWRPRRSYRFSSEITVYVAPDHGRRGVGSELYAALFPLMKALGIHAVLGGIALPNDASIALHEKFGLTKVAHFKETGFKFNRWIDVGYWEAIL